MNEKNNLLISIRKQKEKMLNKKNKSINKEIIGYINYSYCYDLYGTIEVIYIYDVRKYTSKYTSVTLEI